MSEFPTAMQRACFELGIKFGSLYHQFVGTPVSPVSAASVEIAIEESIENQPYCVRVDVDIDREVLEASVDDTWGYTEIGGDLLSCRIVVEVDGVRAVAELVDVEGYPEMRLIGLEEQKN